MHNHNKAQQSKNRVHISWDILYVRVIHHCYSCATEVRPQFPPPVLKLFFSDDIHTNVYISFSKLQHMRRNKYAVLPPYFKRARRYTQHTCETSLTNLNKQCRRTKPKHDKTVFILMGCTLCTNIPCDEIITKMVLSSIIFGNEI